MTATVKLYKDTYISDSRVWFSSGPFSNNYNSRFVLNGEVYETINEFMIEKAQALQNPPAYGATDLTTVRQAKDLTLFWDLRLFDIY